MPAPAPGEVFSYTARRSDYLSLVVAFAMLIILEAVHFFRLFDKGGVQAPGLF
jgi:hypothetical protein